MQVWRGLLDVWRRPSLVLTSWLLATLFGFLCGGIFYDLQDDLPGIQNRAGALFFTLVFLAFLSVTSIDSLLTERTVVHKEQRLGYYPAALYVLAKALIDALLMRAIPAVLFSAPLYFLAGFRGDRERYALFTFVVIAFTIGAQLQAMLIVEWSARAGNAMVVFVLVLIVQMLLAGNLVNSDSIPSFFESIQFTSLFYYAFEALAINEFQVQPRAPCSMRPDLRCGHVFS